MKQLLAIQIFLFLLICTCPGVGNAQTNTASGQKQSVKQEPAKTVPVLKDTVFFELPDSANYKSARTYWDELPEFPGGVEAMNKYVVENTNYPESAVNDKIEGRVFMRFAIESDGSTSDIQVFIGLRSDLNEECIRVVKEMPKWKPGTTVLRAEKGWYRTTIKWMYSIPFTFSLTKDESTKGIIITPR